MTEPIIQCVVLIGNPIFEATKTVEAVPRPMQNPLSKHLSSLIHSLTTIIVQEKQLNLATCWGMSEIKWFLSFQWLYFPINKVRWTFQFHQNREAMWRYGLGLWNGRWWRWPKYVQLVQRHCYSIESFRYCDRWTQKPYQTSFPPCANAMNAAVTTCRHENMDAIAGWSPCKFERMIGVSCRQRETCSLRGKGKMFQEKLASKMAYYRVAVSLALVFCKILPKPSFLWSLVSGICAIKTFCWKERASDK